VVFSPQTRWAILSGHRGFFDIDKGAELDVDASARCDLDSAPFMQFAVHKRLMMACANYGYLDFVLNWVHHVRKIGVSNFVVAAMDDRIHTELQRRSIPTFRMLDSTNEYIPSRELVWGSHEFFERGRRTVGLIVNITRCGVDVLLSDVDTVWLRNPYDFIDKYPKLDVLVSTDSLQSLNILGGLEPERIIRKWDLNIGVMHFTSRSSFVAADWLRRLEADTNLWDQAGFNDLVRAPQMPTDANAKRKGREDGGRGGADDECAPLGISCAGGEFAHPVLDYRAYVGVLPAILFCSGHTYFVQQQHKLHAGNQSLAPFVVHTTFTFSKTLGKRHRLREGLLWDADPPEYFNRTGGYMSFEMDVPDALLHGEGSFSYDGHIELVWHQVWLTQCTRRSIRPIDEEFVDDEEFDADADADAADDDPTAPKGLSSAFHRASIGPGARDAQTDVPI